MIESPLLDRILAQKARQTRQSIILEILEGHLGPVPSDLAEQVRAIEDESRLKDLTHYAGTCTDLEAFRIRLNTR